MYTVGVKKLHYALCIKEVKKQQEMLAWLVQ